MNLKDKITEEVKDAMRSGNEIKKRTLRMTQAAIKQIEVDKRIELDDEGVMAILQKEIKIRKEAVEESKRAGREDLIAAAEAEIDVLKSFLPEELSSDALRELAVLVIAELNANSMADMGRVIKELMPKVAGRASGADVSAMVRLLLQ